MLLGLLSKECYVHNIFKTNDKWLIIIIIIYLIHIIIGKKKEKEKELLSEPIKDDR